MRNTKQKTAIKEILERGGHLSAEEIYVLIKNKMKIDISTIYRNLNMMAENSEVEKITNPEGVAIYHIKSEHHGHLICRSCNAIFEIPCDLCEQLHTLSKDMSFVDTEHVVNIYGYCRNCKGEK
ncbi:MAG: ferric uptake regulator, Fur family [Clostridiales bacterium]|nr:ferric uptake regulator, Fur family [Clostridiales bacterium]